MDSGSICYLDLLFEEGCHLVPEAWLAATDAGVPCLYGPTGAIVKFRSGAIVVSVGALASHHV